MIYTGLKYKVKPPWTINVHFKKEWRIGREHKSFLGVGTSGSWVGTGKGGMRVNMMDVFCLHIWKQNNETCWNYSKKGRRGRIGRTMEGVNLTETYYKHIWKYHNVSPCATIIYQKNFLKRNCLFSMDFSFNPT
jgi:hypothetical protein